MLYSHPEVIISPTESVLAIDVGNDYQITQGRLNIGKMQMKYTFVKADLVGLK